MSPSLDSLSIELLDIIISFAQSPSSLINLALVSRKFNTLATTYLYRDVFLESNCPKGGNRHMLPFTFLILQKPSIASLVRSFTFRGLFRKDDAVNYDCDYDYARLPWPDHPERDDILRQRIKEVSESEGDESQWLENVLPQYAPCDSVILSLILLSLPNLRRLDMEIDCFDNTWLRWIFEKVASSMPPFDVKPAFTQLTDIILVGNSERYPTEYALFETCCRLPSVKRLYGHRLGEDKDGRQLSTLGDAIPRIESSEPRDSKQNPDDPFQSSGPKATTIGMETLELRDSKLHHEDLPIIFRSLRSPHTIIYHIGISGAWTSIKTPAILSAVSIHANSVRRLAVDHEDYYPFTEGVNHNDIADPISFISFVALTHLRVAPLFLFGHEDLHYVPESGSMAETAMLNRLCGALPVNLESLYVTNADFVFSEKHAHIERAFEVLLRQMSCVPHLRELVFEGEFEEEGSILRAARIIRIAGGAGVNAVAVTHSHHTKFKERGWGWDEDVSFETCVCNDIHERVQVWPELRWWGVSTRKR